MTVVESPPPEIVTVDDGKCYLMGPVVVQINGICIEIAV